MSWGYRLYQSILKLFQLNGKDSDSVYDITNEYKGYKEGSYGDDKKHGDQGVHYEVYSDKHLGNDGDEIKEFGLDLDNFVVDPEIIRTNNPHYSL